MNWYRLAKEKEKKKKNTNVLYHGLMYDDDMGIGIFDSPGDGGGGDMGGGGEASASSYDPEELEKGIKVEMEHTDDPEEAKRIALDHLLENPKYYSKLEVCMKEEASKKESERVNFYYGKDQEGR